MFRATQMRKTTTLRTYICTQTHTHTRTQYGAPVEDQHVERYNQTSGGKMEKSFVNFKLQYPEWDAPPEGKVGAARHCVCVS